MANVIYGYNDILLPCPPVSVAIWGSIPQYASQAPKVIGWNSKDDTKLQCVLSLSKHHSRSLENAKFQR
jgi:hypothetical protein